MPASARRARASAKIAPAATADVEVIAANRAAIERQVEDARESITATAARISGTVEDSIDSVKSTVRGVLAISDHFQREPVAWSMGALSVGFALGYGLGRAHHSKGPGGRASRLASFADETAAELGTFFSSLVPQNLTSEIQDSLGVNVATALESIARREQPRRRRARKPKTRSRAKSRAKRA
jgi:hypothetical protein